MTLLILAGSWILAAPDARSQETTDGSTTTTTSPTSAPALDADDPLASPRSTVKTFLLAMKEKRLDTAADCLDLTGIPEERRAKKGEELAQLLHDYIAARGTQVELTLIPDEPDYGNPDAPDSPYTFAWIKDEAGQAQVVVARGSEGHWRVTVASLAELPTLYEAARKSATTRPTAEPGVPEHLSSAQATLRTFLDAMDDAEEDGAQLEIALQCVDLSKMSAALREDRGPLRAKRLRLIIEYTHEDGIIDETIPSDPQAPPFTLYDNHAGSIVIAPDDEGRWRFTADTMAGIEDLWESLSHEEGMQEKLEEAHLSLPWELWLESKMPASLRHKWLGLQYWQWLSVLLIVFVGIVVDLVVRFAVGAALTRQLDRHRIRIDDRVRTTFLRPLGVLAMGAFWWIGVRFLVLPESWDLVLFPAAKVVTCIAGVWVVYRLIDLVGAYLAGRAEKTKSKFDDLLVPLVRRTLKLVVIVVGFVFLADVFEWELTNVLAGLGIGGLAIGLASRETIQNFFGSITVLVERPFQIGDWIVVGDVEGTVESVGFRSTRVRTFYNSLVTVPNGSLLTSHIDNYGARRFRRIKAMLSLTYDTPPEKIDAFCEGIRELIRRHPYTRKDYFHVYFNQFADASLNVLLYCFHETPDWGTELRERHRLFNDILRLAELLGVEFAFPTQTIHLHQESASPAGEAPVIIRDDPGKAGRQTARTIVKDAGLAGTFPPPVSFDSLESRGESDDGDA